MKSFEQLKEDGEKESMDTITELEHATDALEKRLCELDPGTRKQIQSRLVALCEVQECKRCKDAVVIPASIYKFFTTCEKCNHVSEYSSVVKVIKIGEEGK